MSVRRECPSASLGVGVREAASSPDAEAPITGSVIPTLASPPGSAGGCLCCRTAGPKP